MAEKSQNGWPVIPTSGDKRLVKTDKIIGRVLGGNVEKVFAHFIAWFDKNVEDVDKGADDWGYAYRPIRGQSSGFSNHASGTAIDLNAMRHPLGKSGTFTAEQAKKIREQLKFYEGVLRWGGDYSGRKDEMHFEINASAAKVAKIAAKISGGTSTPEKPVTPPKAPSKPSDTVSVVDYLKSKGRDSSFKARSSLAVEYGIKGYKGTAAQNTQLLNALRNSAPTPPKAPSKPSGYNGNSLVDYLKSKGQSSSFATRRILAKRHGIDPYSGTASQNLALLKLLRGK